MEVIVERAAGLDVHKRSVVVTVQTPEVRETRTYGTMTEGLCAMGWADGWSRWA